MYTWNLWLYIWICLRYWKKSIILLMILIQMGTEEEIEAAIKARNGMYLCRNAD